MKQLSTWKTAAGLLFFFFLFGAAANAQVDSPGTYEGNVIRAQSTFYGYDSLVQRGYPNYDYSVHLIKTGEDTGERHRAFIGGRWTSSRGDGDHILQYTSGNGAPNTWSMWSNAPEFWQGLEDGYPNEWFSNNVLEPEVMRRHNGGWIMYTQVQIDPGQPIDIPGQVATTAADRIMLLTSPDAKNWTRKQDRGVIVNVPNPTATAFHHQEAIYVPWDADGKPYWMYVAVNVNNVFLKHYRVRSADPETFDWGQKEETFGMQQLGNQIGYLEEAPGGPLFVRITFTEHLGKTVPALQYSEDGLNWGGITNILEGPANNALNKSTYFLGLSTIEGTGKIEYLGNNTWKAKYAASTSNSPVVPDIYYSEIGMGDLTLTLDGTENVAVGYEFNTNGNAQGWTNLNQTSLSVSGGKLVVTSSGVDPMIQSPDNLNIDASKFKYVKIRLKNNTSSNVAELFFKTNASTVYSQTKSAALFTATNAAGFTEYIFDMSTNANWTGTIKQLRFDPGGASGTYEIEHIRVSEWGHLYNSYTRYWGFDTNTYAEGWIGVGISSQTINGGANLLTAVNSDPQFHSPAYLKVSALQAKKVKVQLLNQTASSTAKLYFMRSTDSGFAETRAQTISIQPNAANYIEYVFDFTGNPNWTGELHQLRLDPADATGQIYVNYILLGN